MKSPSQTLRKELQKKHGGSWDLLLFAPLRDHADDPAIKRVDEILSLLVAAARHLADVHDNLRLPDAGGVPEFLDLHGRLMESQRAYYQTIELLNQKLRRYRWEATLSADLDGFRSELHPAVTSLRNWELVEPLIVARLLRLLDKPGEFSRFRRCSDCRQWFYAIRGHQQFCGDVCRRRHEAQDPEFKEKRRTYMRERYRPLQKELEKRSRTLAKGKRAKEGKA